jgi:hypothetical protein
MNTSTSRESFGSEEDVAKRCLFLAHLNERERRMALEEAREKARDIARQRRAKRKDRALKAEKRTFLRNETFFCVPENGVLVLDKHRGIRNKREEVTVSRKSISKYSYKY